MADFALENAGRPVRASPAVALMSLAASNRLPIDKDVYTGYTAHDFNMHSIAKMRMPFYCQHLVPQCQRVQSRASRD